ERTDPVLFGYSYDYVGDLSETVALMWPKSFSAHQNESFLGHPSPHPSPARGEGAQPACSPHNDVEGIDVSEGRSTGQAPSPLAGEGWGEGYHTGALSICVPTTHARDCDSDASINHLARGPPSPARGEGA
ncbi:hypothetical protein CJI59_37170, partial [Streptomyces sp. Alain-F2R5]